MIKSFLLIALCVLFGVSGQLLLKSAMVQIGRVGAGDISRPVDLLVRLMTEPRVLLALSLYGAGFIIWSIVLSRLNLSLAYPLLAATYIIAPIAALIVFHEQISVLRWAGIAVISIGVAMVGRS